MFRFREISEIKGEKNLGLREEEKKCMKIKPEREISKKEIEEAVNFWVNEFAREAAIANNQTNNKG